MQGDTNTNGASAQSTEQQLVFHDDALSQRISMGTLADSTFDHDKDNTGDLGNYLQRPVRIHTFTWAESTFHNTAISPWFLYFNNTYIKRKMENYARIQCRLHLKFVVNASPFYYGSLRANYIPLVGNRAIYTVPNDQIHISQTPGLYLEPQNMSSAEMVLPFLCQQTWLDIHENGDFINQGRLSFVQFANLRSANGVTGAGVTVTVYAWAEDVKIAGPTSGLALQGDEYDITDGVISEPATAIANVADRLTDIPVIGTAAMATSMGAKAIAGIAKLFGYSNPPIIEDVRPMTNRVFHSFANVETRFPEEKLSIDPKNEVSISNSLCGIDNTDPLAFKTLLTHESFVQGTLWDGTRPSNYLLWSTVVTPNIQASITTGVQDKLWSTPLSYFGRMFRYWRGSITYKFRIIKTQYHKGRLSISWDPNIDITSNPDVETTCFTKIVDLEEEDEFEITIPYKGVTPYLDCNTESGLFSNGSSPTYATFSTLKHNGVLTVRVLNKLTGPATSPEVDILVYTKAGEDFQYAVPVDVDNLSPLQIQGSILDNTETIDSKLAMVTTGENYASLRPILHRVSLWSTQYVGSNRLTEATYPTPGRHVTTNIFPRIPRPYGYDVAGGMNWAAKQLTVGNAPFNFCKTHPLDYTLNCFIGYRGSTNMYIAPSSSGLNVRKIDNIAVSRVYKPWIVNPSLQARNRYKASSDFANDSNYPRVCNTVATSTAQRIESGQQGFTVSDASIQPGMSVNIPQYTKLRFNAAFVNDRDVNLTNSEFIYDNVAVNTNFTSTLVGSATTDWPVMNIYYSAGVDFNPVFFLCCPELYSFPTPSAINLFTP